MRSSACPRHRRHVGGSRSRAPAPARWVRSSSTGNPFGANVSPGDGVGNLRDGDQVTRDALSGRQRVLPLEMRQARAAVPRSASSNSRARGPAVASPSRPAVGRSCRRRGRSSSLPPAAIGWRARVRRTSTSPSPALAVTLRWLATSQTKSSSRSIATSSPQIHKATGNTGRR